MDDSLNSKCSSSEDCKIEKFKSGDRDRLSELPDSLILKIISSLDMRQVVRTSLISKRWKDLWTTIPCLNFMEDDESSGKSCYSSISTRNFICRALLLYKGVKIREFRLFFENGIDKSMFFDLDLWLRLANEREVEVVSVDLKIDPECYYLLPQCMYSCSSIRKLLLCGCELQIRGDVKWGQLKKFTFDGDPRNHNAISQIVSGCPQLEVLDLEFLGSYRNFNFTIQSNSLKKLSINNHSDYSELDPSNCRVLTLCAPKLEKLEVCGDAYHKCSLIGVSSLTDVTLKFTEKWISRLQMTLRQILPSIRHVELVTLSACTLKVLIITRSRYPVYSLSNVKLLQITCPIDPFELASLLQIFPKLEMLLIGWNTESKYDVQSGKIRYSRRDVGDAFEFDKESFLTSEAIMLESFLLHLRSVKISWYLYEASLFQFVEFLLKHATMLKRIAIRKAEVLGKPKLNDTFLAEQKLQMLQESFPYVELICFAEEDEDFSFVVS